jgi:hypothetical protein
MREPQIGDIWRWTWTGNVQEISTCLVTQKANKQEYFICLELETGVSSLWAFAEQEMGRWEHLS